ncbi:MAG: thiamine-phosphate kinase [Burkholderiaceae bacterium]|nr:MAG: thiamine-phosphate kinase [Burkholderiaceae bacterium]
MMNEFELIEKYFTRSPRRAKLGVGDDCAIIAPASDMELAVTTDTLISGRHFFPFVDPRKLGHKALAVSLSDLAAMGATPRYFTLALSLPKVDEDWLQEFSRGLFNLADSFHCELIGGDTTCGPLSITITAIGELRKPFVLRRDAARAGDDIWISGTLGDAALALRVLNKQAKLPEASFAYVADRLEQPLPRVALGAALRPLAHAAIDISDGLIGDLKHILDRSGVGAEVWLECIPVSEVMSSQPLEVQYECALAGGDDYELCFTARPNNRNEIEAAGKEVGVRLTRVGHISGGEELRLLDKNGQSAQQLLQQMGLQSYDHFA